MKFNVGKCKVLRLGKNNLNYKYYLNEQELEPVGEERDLGIIITNDLKVSRQCKSAYNKLCENIGNDVQNNQIQK